MSDDRDAMNLNEDDEASGTYGASEPSAVDASLPTEDELTQAAREARAGPYVPGGAFKPPNTMKILALVLLCVAGFFVYFVVFAGTSLQRTEKIRHRVLEQKTYDYDKQQRYVAANGFVPAGPTHKPLTTDEQAELGGLREKYGRMKIVEKEEKGATAAATTAPAGAP